MSHISATRIIPAAATIEAQDWTDTLDQIGALATADDLQGLLAIAPADVDPDLMEMVREAIAVQRQWPPVGYAPGADAQQLIGRIDVFLGQQAE